MPTEEVRSEALEIKVENGIDVLPKVLASKSKVIMKPLSPTLMVPLPAVSQTEVRLDTNFRIPKGKKNLSQNGDNNEGKMKSMNKGGRNVSMERWKFSDHDPSIQVNSKKELSGKEKFAKEKNMLGRGSSRMAKNVNNLIAEQFDSGSRNIPDLKRRRDDVTKQNYGTSHSKESVKTWEEISRGESSKRKRGVSQGKNSEERSDSGSDSDNESYCKRDQIQVDLKELKPKLPTQSLPQWVRKMSKDLFFDCHCHLDLLFVKHLPQMELESYDEVLHAFPAMRSLGGLITSFCQPSLWSSHLQPPSPLVLSMLALTGHSYTVGVHPHFASQLLHRPYMMRHLYQLLSEPGVVGLGECGVDSSAGAALEDQVEAFRLQVKLAVQLKLPLVLYIRFAETEALQVLDEVQLPSNWPIHRQWCDGSGSWSRCSAWLARYPASVVGLTAHACDDTVARLLPLDRLVLQTDAPHSSDSSYFSLPVHVVQVAERVAVLKNLSPETLLRASRENVRRIYRV